DVAGLAARWPLLDRGRRDEAGVGRDLDQLAGLHHESVARRGHQHALSGQHERERAGGVTRVAREDLAVEPRALTAEAEAAAVEQQRLGRLPRVAQPPVIVEDVVAE